MAPQPVIVDESVMLSVAWQIIAYIQKEKNAHKHFLDEICDVDVERVLP
jgi:hypothetical protein